ncbi:MAG: 16S rRNA (adenine(1518)-N(6)/adenine(1519)-N(6))-dimethyltransferase RsmA [Desulfonatronovibrio sp.]
MNFGAKKSLGQNFLIDENICRKMADALEIAPDDNVLEIGPGRGALTRPLSDKGALVYALEKDPDLCFFLKSRMPELNIACADALDYAWSRLERVDRLRITGNLPYNVASRLLWDMAGQISTYKKAVFMVQREVGKRIVAQPGSKTYGALWIQSFWIPEILFGVSPQVFRPSPKVESVVLGFKVIKRGEKFFSNEKLARTIRIMFQKRRKQIGTILKSYWNYEIIQFIESQGIDPRSRPEDLSPADFQGLSRAIF